LVREVQGLCYKSQSKAYQRSHLASDSLLESPTMLHVDRALLRKPNLMGEKTRFCFVSQLYAWWLMSG
jgi:hypothetical protein